MILSSELRIGNWVTVIGNFEQIEEISKDYFETKSVISMCSDDETEPKPIPLTEEILLKCGFVKDGDLYHNNIALHLGSDGTFNYNVNFFEYSNLQEIKYVHQLQNLYFFLTMGEELNIEL